MADDWAAFDPQPAPADSWAAFNPQAAPEAPAQPDSPTANDALPEAFVARAQWGQALGRIVNAGAQEAGNVVKTADATPLGFSDDDLTTLQKWGIFHDPKYGKPNAVQFATEALTIPAAQAWQAIGTGLSASIRGAGAAIGQAATELGESQGMAQRAQDEATNAGNWFLIESGFGRFARVRSTDIGPQIQEIGGLPRPEDFSNAAGALHAGEGAPPPHIEQRLQTLWQEKGIHPAEAAADAQTDAFLHHDLTAPASETAPITVPEAERPLVVAGDVTQSLGAAVTSDPPLIPPSVQPLSPQGSLSTLAQGAMEQLTGLGKNIQFMLDPMATGSDRAMVIAKDAMNSVRRIRWDHARADADIAARFTPEQREFMWIAADEESVLRQTGETPTDTGLMTLGPEERAAVEEMHERAQSAWLHAQDAGIVEGEGLPAYTPRMVMNVANVAADLSPRALNELGRNVFTRTSQTLHRKYLTAEETEAAAKELVGDRMAKQGASVDEIQAAVDKVQIAKDIRALPLATARLQEAAVWRDMINKIEDAGKAAGEPTVAVGFKPDNSWFTIAGHPSFTRWEPMLVRDAETGSWAAKMDADGRPIFQPKPIYLAPDFRGPMEAILDQSPSNNKAVAGAMTAYDGLMAIKGKAMTAILNSPLIHNEVVWSKVMEAAGGKEWLGFGLYFRGNRIVNGNLGRAQELIERGLNPMGPRGSFQDITGMMEQPTIGPRESWTSKIIAAVPGLFDEGAATKVKLAIDKAGDFVHNTLLWDRVRDVQFGLADHLSDSLVAKGADRLTADRIAGHFSNIIVGSIPKEAMSSGARATANLLLFSRSFTLGNLSTFKQAALGLPKPLLAQIERDFFDFKENAEGVWESPQSALGPDAAGAVRSMATGIARRKAISTILMSAGLYYVGNALLQHAMNIAVRDATLGDEIQGYARRYNSLMNDVKGGDWFELRHMIGRLSPTYDNEPRKQDRAYIGDDAQSGAAIYARNPTGKFGEEMIGYPTMPMEMLRRKLSPMAGGLLDILENDKGFGQKIYDENDRSISGDAATAFAVAKHLVMKHLPEGQISAGLDLLRGDGDPKVDAMRAFGPVFGFTASEGRPGGMAKGELGAVQDEAKVKFGLAWPDIKKQVLSGDEDGARQAMTGLGLSVREQISLINTAKNPSAIKGRTALDFMRKATPEQLDRFNRARGQ
jgi:hypothetical protein